MKLKLLSLLILAGPLLAAASGQPSQEKPSDEAAIRQNVAEYMQAFNAHDDKALAGFWSPDAVYINRISGEEVTAADIAASAPKTPADKGEWLPLGVFALTQDGQASGADPTLYMQLVLSKEGIISGTLNNTATGQVQTLEGIADKKSQRAAWGVAGKERPIIETGISNLTQDTGPALIHFADGQTQQWLLVRLDEPKQ